MMKGSNMSKLSRIKDSLGRLKLDEKGQPIMAFKQLFTDFMREFTEPSQKAPFFRYGDEWLFLLARGVGPRRRVRSTKNCEPIRSKLVPKPLATGISLMYNVGMKV